MRDIGGFVTVGFGRICGDGYVMFIETRTRIIVVKKKTGFLTLVKKEWGVGVGPRWSDLVI